MADTYVVGESDLLVVDERTACIVRRGGNRHALPHLTPPQAIYALRASGRRVRPLLSLPAGERNAIFQRMYGK